jgi:hypothetical protein
MVVGSLSPQLFVAAAIPTPQRLFWKMKNEKSAQETIERRK